MALERTVIRRDKLVGYCEDLLESSAIKDYCPNGLQVEGSHEISRIVTGVTASQALIDRAVELDADAIIVHHGYFWKGESSTITGIKHKRVKALLENNISLIAYHLPLDVHPELGNNAQLAKVLELDVLGLMEPGARPAVGNTGRLKCKMTAGQFAELINTRLGRECLHIGDPEQELESIAWCTGAAQSMIDVAVGLGVDAYLSGEISEPTVHIARETGLHYFSAGHHATERYGIKALGEHLAEQFQIECFFEDVDNPV